MNKEEMFLTKFILDRYNFQYKKNLRVSECRIHSINPRPSSRVGYEVITNRLDDFVRIRVYMTFTEEDNLGSFKLESDRNQTAGTLGDEVFVAFGSFDRYYLQSGTYRFKWIDEDDSGLDILVLENGEPLVTENGEYILLEGFSL